MLTVKEAMKIDCLKKTRLAAGENGTSRVIKSVTVMEVYDIVNWIKGGEFIITSFYSLKDNIKLQINILYELNALNAAGIAIKTNRGVNIDGELIKVCNEIKFPLIEIPEDVTYLDIMTPLNLKIFELECHFRLVEEYIKSVVFHTYKNTEAIIDRGNNLGYDLKNGYIYTICIDINNFNIDKKYDSIYIKDDIYYFINNVISIFKIKKQIINYMIIRNVEDVTLFIQTHDKITSVKYGKCILDLILKHIDINYKHIEMKVGIANISQRIEGMEKGYEESKYAIKIGKVIEKDKNCYLYKDVEIYSLIYENCFENLSSFINSTLGELTGDKELMDTISMYFECNENILMASSKLFIHQNTLKYRLKSIEKITGLNVKYIGDKVKLYFGVIAYKIS